MKRFSFPLFLFFNTLVFAATNYYSQGSLPANLTSSWKSSLNAQPSSFTLGDVFIIQSGHTMSTTAPWTVSGTNAEIILNGGSLTFAHNSVTQRLTITVGDVTVNTGVTVTINNGNTIGGGDDLIVDDILNNTGIISFGVSANGKVSNTGKYNHTGNGGAIPSPVTWTVFSTCRISGVTTTLPSGFGQGFGNIIYDSPSQTANVTLNTVPTTITNFSINSTGTGSLVLGNNVAPSTSLKIKGGVFDLSSFTSNGLTLADSLVVGAGAKLRIGGTNSFPVNYNAYKLDGASTIEYYGTSTQTIAAKKYGNLMISGARTGNITLANSGTIGIAGMFSPTTTFSSGGFSTIGSTVDFNGASSQIIPAFKFNNLIISNTATNTSTSATGGKVIADGVLTVSGLGLNVQFNDTLSVGQVHVDAAGSLELLINATLIVNNGNTGGDDLIVDGLLKNKGILRFNNATGLVNGIYDHAKDGDTIPTFNWSNGSTCMVSGVYNTSTLYGLNQNFNDFTYNCVSQMFTVNFNSQLKNVLGVFDIQSTGSTGSIVLFNTDTTMNVGSFSITSSTLIFSNNSGANDTIRINSDTGYFSQSGSTIDMSIIGGKGIFHFVNSNQTAYRSSGSINGNIGYRVSKYLHAGAGIISNAPFIVDSGAMLYVEEIATIGGTGNFLLNSGATLEIKNPSGITTSGNTGAIQMAGSRTFSNGAKYIYKGNTAQQTGNGLPSSVSMLLIDNAAGVTLNNALTVDDSLWLYNGELNTGSNPLNIGGILKMGFGSSIAGTGPIYNSGSTLVYASSGTFNRGLEWSTTGGGGYPNHVDIQNNTTLNLGYGGTGTLRETAGDLIIASGSELTMNSAGYEMTAPLIVNGDLNNAGTLTLSSQTGGGFVIGSNWYNIGSFTPNNRNVTFDGGSQNLTGATTFDSLSIDNGTVVTLNNDIHVSQELNFVNGSIVTGSNAVIVTTPNDVVRTSGHIIGNLKKYIPYGSNISKTFEIGDANYYTPVDISFSQVDTAGYLTASSSVSGQSLAGSNLNTSKKVNRFWKLINSGIAYDNYNATFNFDGADVDGGANANNFIVARHDGTNWSLPTTGATSISSTQMIGQSGFGEFAVGELVTFSIMTMPYGGGLITPMGITNVAYGNTLSMTITPNAGNIIDSVKVDGIIVDSTTSYTFLNVIAPHTINAYFSIQDVTPPNAPQNLVVTKGDGVLQLHWTPNSEADFSQYYFYYGTAPNPALNIDSTTGGINDTLKTVYGLTNYLTYYIRITAVDIHGNISSYSNEVSMMPVDLTPPLFVQYPVAVGGDGQVQLHWNPNTETDFSKYYIYGGLTSSPTTRIDSALSGINDTMRTITGLVNNTLYYFRMTSVDTSGNESNYSIDIFATPVDITVPAPPQNLVATAGDQSVLIHWNPSSAIDFKKYYIYRSTSPNPTSIIDSLSNVNDTVKFYGGLTNYQQYFFRVTVADTNRNMSVYSNEASAMPSDKTPPSAPTNLDVTDSVASYFTITWNMNAESDIAKYYIYRDTIPNATTLVDSTVNVVDTVRAFTNLTIGQSYYFRVAAVDTSYNISPLSNEATAVPFMIYGITATAIGNGVIAPPGLSYINHGDSITYTISASPHHHIDSLTIDASVISVDGTTFNGSSGKQKKSFAKEINPFNLNTIPGVELNLPITIIGSGNDDTLRTYTFSTVTSGHTIKSYFSINTFTINASVFGNGIIIPSGNTAANYGDTISYSIIPDLYHHVDSVVVDGIKIDSVTSYTFINSTSAHSIDAYFSANVFHHFVVEAGSLGPIGTQGAGQNFTILTTAVDTAGNPVGSFTGNVWFSSTDPLMGVLGGNYSVPFTSGQHGPQIVVLIKAGMQTITVYDSVSGKSGTSCPFMVTPAGLAYFGVKDTAWQDLGQQIQGIPFPVKIVAFDTYANVQTQFTGSVEVSVSGGATVVQGGGATPNFTNGILNSHLMEINSSGFYSINVFDPLSENMGSSNYFMVVPHSYTISSFAMNGTITPFGNTNVNYGDTIQYTFAPNSRYRIDSIFVDGAKINDSTLQYTFVNVTSPHSIFIFTSANVNMAPIFTSVFPDTAIARFDTLNFQYHAFDPEGGKINYLLLNPSSGVSIDTTGLLKFIPAVNANGIQYIIVQAIDDSLAVITDTVKIRVNIYGDVSGNGTVTAFDAALVLQNVISAMSFTPLQNRIGDVTGNNGISSLDASYLLQYTVGLISSFPGGLGKKHQTDAVLSAFSFRIEKSKEADHYDLFVSVNKPSQVLGLSMDLGYDSTIVIPRSFSKTAISDSMTIASKFFTKSVKLAMAGIKPMNNAGDVIKFTFTLKDPNYPKNAILFTMKKFMLNETDHTNDVGGITLNVRDLAQLPTVYKLEQNFPNPFNPTTTINYQLPDASSVTIIVFNLLGQEVKTLISEQQSAGYYSLIWNGNDNTNRTVSSGVYLYRISAIGPQNKRFSEVKKMLLIR